MTKKRVADYLSHMLEAVFLAQSYVEGLHKEDFLEDKQAQQAVILNLLIIGESASYILREYPDFSEKYPELPWQEMRGMRNRMVHGYFEINLDIVWDTVHQSLPELEQQVISIQKTFTTSVECAN